MAINPAILARIFGGQSAAGMDPEQATRAGWQALGTMGASMLANSGGGMAPAPSTMAAIGQGLLAGKQGFAQSQLAAQKSALIEASLAEQQAKIQQQAARQDAIRRMLGGTTSRPTLEQAQGQIFGVNGLSPAAVTSANQLANNTLGQPQPQAATGPLANLPPQARQLLLAMSPDRQEKVLVDMFFPKPADVPSRVREAQLVSQQTGRPVGEILAQWRADDGQNVNVSVGGPSVYMPKQQTKFAETYGTGLAKSALALEESAQGASGIYNKAAEINDMLAGMDTNALSGAKVSVGRIANALGIDPTALGLPSTGEISQAEAATALQNQLALSIRSPESGMGMPGAVSNRDIKFLMASVPNLTQTPQGRQLLVDTLKERANFLRYLVEKQNEYMRSHGGQLDQGWSGFRLNAIEQYQGFSDLRARAEQVASQPAPAPAPTPNASGLTEIQSPAAPEMSIDDLLNTYGGE